ncbi:MAG: heavy-metal-associated domain-containing protein [Gemmatimonadaceae bacterium]|nr:heavy-metal-associated domain-containing protein [Gemmatimonadaceae bacterium]
MTALSMQISGMSCGHCVAAVKKALESVAGVAVHEVAIGRAQIEYDDAQTSTAAIVQVVEDEGYGVTTA